MDVSWPTATSWAAAACFALAIFAWILVRRARRIDGLREEYVRRLAELADAEREWRDAILNGTVAMVQEARRKVVDLRAELMRLKQAMAGLLVLLVCAGCATREAAEKVVVVSDHAQIVEPGFIVPDYPDGETRWWLCTPTGLELMVPAFRREEW